MARHADFRRLLLFFQLKIVGKAKLSLWKLSRVIVSILVKVREEFNGGLVFGGIKCHINMTKRESAHTEKWKIF